MKTKLIDLHTHSNYSDGDLTPLDLVEKAKKEGVSYLAITDHDTLNGNKNIYTYRNRVSDISILSGIELTVQMKKGRMHLLGYGIDVFDKELNRRVDKLKLRSINSVLAIIEQIKKDYGIVIDKEDIDYIVNKDNNVGRTDIAKVLVRYGYVKDNREAFDKYLIDAHKKTRNQIQGLTYEDAIDMVKQSGGIPVLAHPYSLELNNSELLSFLRELKQVGLQGVEVYHSNHTTEQTNHYLEIVKNIDLLISGGSDYHGKTVKPDVELGRGKNNNIKIKELSIIKSTKKDNYLI